VDQQLIDLYHHHLGVGFDRQLRLADFLEKKAPGADWEYDPATGVLAFGPKVAFEAPVIGSHAARTNSWMWAWADHHLKLTLTNRALGTTVRALAARLGVHAFAENAFPLEPLLGADLAQSAAHVFGIILAGELGYDAYFIADHDAGRETILVRDDRLTVAERHPLGRVLTVFPQLAGAMPVLDARAALTHYAKAYNLTVTDEAGRLTLTGDGKGELAAAFDARGRLTSLDGNVTPQKGAAPPPAKTKPATKKKPVPAKKAPAAKKKAAAPPKTKPVAAKKKPRGTT
jgi:hypothetical protein